MSEPIAQRGSVTGIVRGLPQRPANADLQWKTGYPAHDASKQMRKYDAY